MKALAAGLQGTVSATYDKTKTSALGRAFQKTINSQQVLGPPLTSFLDVFTQYGVTVYASAFDELNGRLFGITAIAGGSATIVMATFDPSTGAATLVGKITISLPNQAATTHTIRGFRVNATGTTNWKIVLATTGSVLINGGTFYVNGVGLADFVPVGFPNIPMATGSGQKAVYMLEDPSAMGSAAATTASAALVYPWRSASSSINTKVFTHNGTAATHQYYAHDLSGTPTVAGLLSALVSSQTTLFSGTSPSAFFSSGTTQPSFVNGDPVIFLNTAPSNFTASTTTAQTAYFVRDLQQVAGSWYWNLATTSGGVAVTPATAVSGMTVMRAYGQCSSLFSFKTGNLPALTGTLLLTNSECHAVPSSTALSGLDCVFLCTTTNMYLGKLSELTSGVTTWASLTTAAVTGSGTDITAPTPTQASFSNELDAAIYVTNTSAFVIHKMVNGSIVTTFGGLNNAYIEGMNLPTVNAGLAAITDLTIRGGFLFLVGSTTGQRGIVAMDLYSDTMFGYSQVISPVLNVPAGSVLKYISTIEQLFDYTDSMEFAIRSAATSTDASFNSASGGWVTIKTAIDNNLAIQPYFQLRVTFDIATYASTTPAQINDLVATFILPTESSDNWQGSVDNSSSNAASPFYTAFRLKQAYTSAVPTMYFRAYDDNGNLVASANTSSNPTFFKYSANNGASWNALGTVPNTALSTELRYEWPSPPGVRVTVSLRES